MIRDMENGTVDLGHNPNATADEIRRFRENFSLNQHLKQTANLNDGAGPPRVDPSAVPPKASDQSGQSFGPNESAMPNRGRRADASDKPRQIIDLLNSFSQPEEVRELQARLKSMGFQLAPVPAESESTGFTEAFAGKSAPGAREGNPVPIPAAFSNGSSSISAINDFLSNQAVRFAGTVPPPFSDTATYYVLSIGLSTSAFEVSDVEGGIPIVAGGAGSGVSVFPVTA